MSGKTDRITARACLVIADVLDDGGLSPDLQLIRAEAVVEALEEHGLWVVYSPDTDKHRGAARGE